MLVQIIEHNIHQVSSQFLRLNHIPWLLLSKSQLSCFQTKTNGACGVIIKWFTHVTFFSDFKILNWQTGATFPCKCLSKSSNSLCSWKDYYSNSNKSYIQNPVRFNAAVSKIEESSRAQEIVPNRKIMAG